MINEQFASIIAAIQYRNSLLNQIGSKLEQLDLMVGGRGRLTARMVLYDPNYQYTDATNVQVGMDDLFGYERLVHATFDEIL